jgi:glycosyltransferase involved in cell wall biosynthesis
VTGFVVPPADPGALAEKIALLRGDEVLRSKLGKNAKERVVERFSKVQMIDRTLALYEELVAGS